MAISSYQYHGTVEEALAFAIAQAQLEGLYLTVIEHWSNETPRVFKPGEADLGEVVAERIGWMPHSLFSQCEVDPIGLHLRAGKSGPALLDDR